MSDVDLSAQIRFLQEHRAQATLALYGVEDPSRFGVVALDPQNRILRFVEKPPKEEAPSRMVNAGAQVLEPEVLDLIPKGSAVSIEREVFPEMTHIWGFPFQGIWIDCGTPVSYLEVHRMLNQGESFVGAGCQVDPGARIVDSVLHPGVVVEEGVYLERARGIRPARVSLQ